MLFTPLPLHMLHPWSGLSFLLSKPFLILQGLVQVKLNRAKLREKTGWSMGMWEEGSRLGLGRSGSPGGTKGLAVIFGKFLLPGLWVVCWDDNSRLEVQLL